MKKPLLKILKINIKKKPGNNNICLMPNALGISTKCITVQLTNFNKKQGDIFIVLTAK